MSHVLNILITLSALVIFLLIDVKRVTRAKLINLMKAVGITALLSSSFWIPALHFGTSVVMTKPYTFPLNGIDLIKYTQAALSNSITYGFTAVALIGFVMAAVRYRQLSRFSREIFWIGISFVILSSSLFPWFAFQNTPMVLLQFPWRFLILPQLGFVYLFSLISSDLLKIHPNRYLQFGIVVLFSVLVVGLSLNSQAGRVNFEKRSPQINADLYPNSNQIQVVQGMVWYRVTNLKQYQHFMTYINTADYLPKMSDNKFQTLSMQRAIQDHDPKLNLPITETSHPHGKTMVVSLSAPVSSLSLPFVIYDNHYTVKLDGKSIPVKTDHNHILTVNKLKAGKHTVQVSYHNGLMSWLITILTALGIGFLLYRRSKYSLSRSNLSMIE